ncbi:hypothetical protein [uncultured Proteiniphilum sp.]|uniref:fimbrial tip adhesin FimD n=1 Tax=uncultured Proteiniphilum sp. TaxID=497637 RepID=UPI002608778E|nr:hypothetical protein [uncultured Proteiniphilum sp.]
MKQKSPLAYLLSLLLLPAGFFSCTDEISPAASDDQIVFQWNIPGSKTRAAVDGEDAYGENKLDRIDLFIFKSTDGSLEAYRTYSGLDATGTYTTVFDKAKTAFPASELFNVYAIANYPGDVSDLSAITNRSELMALAVTDADIYRRAATRRFLMDGSLKDIALNDGQPAGTILAINLQRAAAKIKVNLRCTGDFPADNHLTLTGYSSYRLVNYVTHTPVLDEAEPFPYPPLNMMSTHIPITTVAENPFQPGLDKGAAFVVYSFANDWSPPRDINNNTYFIVNLRYTPEGGTEDKNSYYKIVVNYNQFPDPAGEENRLKRNSFYEVTATIDKKGSETEEIPTPVACTYEIAAWKNEEIEIESAEESSSSARYLMVSENTVSLANLETTNQIKYYASAPITIGAVTITYVNNRGVETTITTTTTPFGERVLVNNLTYAATPPATRGYIRPVRIAVADVTSEENGYLEVVSRLLNLGSNNSLLVKQIRFTVSLNDGKTPALSEDITITQYPEVYATQTQGWFSSKKPMSASTSGSPGTGVWGAFRQCLVDSERPGIGTVTHLTRGYNGLYQNQSPFNPRIVRNYTSSNGESAIWTYGSYSTGNQTWGFGSLSSSTHINAHIYHVHVSTIPAGKTLGYPVITGTFADDNTTANANTISPAFMVASQLGVTSAGVGRSIGYDHCKNYVEVTYRSPKFTGSITEGAYSGALSDWVVYSDWRLPTAAEIGIIADYQNNDGAVAIVLAGQRYYALTGNSTETVNALSSGTNGNYIRCVRDVKPGDPNFKN